MAYTSTELGAQQVFVRTFPELTGKWQVSESDGHEPVWAPDGNALYFVNNGMLARVDVVTEGTSPFGRPTVLFPWAYAAAAREAIGHALHPDGDRFLMVQTGPGAGAEVHIVTNWFTELCERMGGC